LVKRVKEAYARGSKNQKLRIISESERHILTAFGLQTQVNLLVTLFQMVEEKRYSEFSELKSLLQQESASGKHDFAPLSEELAVYRALSLEGIVSAAEELENLQRASSPMKC